MVHSDAATRFTEAIAAARMSELDNVFAEDVELDATVPYWRFTVRGVEEVRAQLAHWYNHPGRFAELQCTPLSFGTLVRFTLIWEEDGVPHATHQAHVLEIDGDRITADHVWCGGRWPASLLAEMAEAAAASG